MTQPTTDSKAWRWPWQKPKRQPLRAIVATRQESLKAQRKRANVLLELAVYKATTTPEQRAAEAAAFFSRASTQ